jgi:hypothetical protein
MRAGVALIGEGKAAQREVAMAFCAQAFSVKISL